MPKFVRFALLLLPTAAFSVAVAVYLPAHLNDRPPAEPSATTPGVDAPKGRLVVVAVFDQMRGDYPERWKHLLDAGGFSTLERTGVWYANAHLPYSCSATGPGHASIGTGLSPSGHGVIENEWFDRRAGGRVLAVSGEKPSLRVPERTDSVNAGFSPERLLADGLGDHLKKQKLGARVFSLALKDRAAVMLGGKTPDGVYAFDTDVGEFHTASHYRDTPHPWAAEFNKSGAADDWFKNEWEGLKPAAEYDAAVGPDDAPGETRFVLDGLGGRVGYGSTFPHTMNIDGQPHPNKRYYERLEASPFGNDLLLRFAEACIDAERLGTGGRTDLLFLGFSANDTVGHKWGPDSHEVLDCTLRTDRLIADMTRNLTERLGPDGWTLIVTADHGICPLPERWAKERPDAERFDPRTELDGVAMGEVLDERFGKMAGGPRGWLAGGVGLLFPNVYLNHEAIQKHGVKVADVAAALAKWAGNRPHVEAAFTREQLTGKPSDDPLTRRCQWGYHPDRGGEVYVVPKAYCLPTGELSLGTSHGSPHPYDTHVPLFAAGAGIPKLGRRAEVVSSLILGPVICHALGVTPPASLPEKLPPGW